MKTIGWYLFPELMKPSISMMCTKDETMIHDDQEALKIYLGGHYPVGSSIKASMHLGQL